MRKTYKRSFTFFTIIFVSFSLNGSFCYAALNFRNFNVTAQSKTKRAITFKIIPSSDNTWGYDIYLNGKPTIHQLTVPAIAGNKGFRTKIQAAKVAKLVVDKIKKGEMPPSITITELNNLKAI